MSQNKFNIHISAITIIVVCESDLKSINKHTLWWFTRGLRVPSAYINL